MVKNIMTKPLKIIFMGTPDFAAESLRAICRTHHEVIAVYSQPPRPKGRGHKVQPSPVHALAEEKNIPVYHPKSLKSAEAQEEFAALNADIAIVAAYGLILPKAVLDAPKYGCINIHASLLPRWRGASPIQHAIWKGDSASGVTLMQMDEGLDTGAIIAKEEVIIAPDTTAATLHDELATLGGEMIVHALEKLSKDGVLLAEAQDDSLSNYAPLLKKEDGIVDWSMSAKEIDRQIRALNPWPGVRGMLQGQEFKIISARPVPGTEREEPGTILDKTGRIACGDGSVLVIETLQPAGKKAMDFASALNGGYIKL